MDRGGEEGEGLRAALFRYDTLADDVRPERRRLVFDSPPRPGDTVLVIDEGIARLVRFEEYHAPLRPVWVVAVLRESH